MCSEVFSVTTSARVSGSSSALRRLWLTLNLVVRTRLTVRFPMLSFPLLRPRIQPFSVSRAARLARSGFADCLLCLRVGGDRVAGLLLRHLRFVHSLDFGFRLSGPADGQERASVAAPASGLEVPVGQGLRDRVRLQRDAVRAVRARHVFSQAPS